MNVVVVIPIYKNELTSFEYKSLVQSMKILNKYDMKLVAPIGLNLSLYHEVFTLYGKVFDVELFAPSFFDGTKGYNRLMLNLNFYKRFLYYDYILIYQLDAYVFADQLLFWARKGYDYIGAPFFKDNKRNEEVIDTEVSGNGGLSLRKVSAFISILQCSENVFGWKGLYLLNRYRGIMRKPLYIIGGILGYRNNMNYFSMYYNDNEDYFYSLLKYKKKNPLNIAPYNDAMKFAFECNPSYLYSITNKLPFGCHAWIKYEYDLFWRKYIE